MSFILVKKLWKEYGSQVVLENLNLEVKEGEFCILVGVFGCGKFIFLKMLLGQEIVICGEFSLQEQVFSGEFD